jgi:hypothetical protein
MATKVFKSGNLMIINKSSIFYVINLPSFDYKFIGTTYVSFIDKFSNEPNITDLIVNIQDEAGTPIGATQQDVIDYLATQTISSVGIDAGFSGVSLEATQLQVLESVSKLDSLNFDAFARLRMSEPQTIFDSKQIADNHPLFFDDQQTSGSGTSSTYNINQSSTILSVSDLTAGVRVRQTFRRFNYQTGTSFLWIRSAVIDEFGTGITKRLGYFDENNGLFFNFSNSVASVGVRSFTSGVAVDTLVPQSSWNIDKLDGTGASGITLDFTKILIFFCDFEWVGTVRFGFFLFGKPFYCHRVDNSNINTVVYMSTPNLPLRTEITNDGTGSVSSITDIYSTVIVEAKATNRSKPNFEP